MTELEHAIKHIKTRADAWAVKEVEEALSEWQCIYDLKNRYCPRLNEHGMLKYPLQEPTEKPMCDRNICISNEYNGIGCDECVVNKPQEPTVTSTYEPMTMVYPTIVCDDAISREAVKNAICDYVAFEEYEDKSHTFTIRPLEKRIDELPSVSTTKNIVNHGTMNITL